MKIFLIDDNTKIKKDFQTILKDFSSGIYMIKSLGGIEKINEAVSFFDPDIIFCNTLLQNLNGYEICKALKSNPLSAKVPVVLTWNEYSKIDTEKFQESKADDQIKQPFDMLSLKNMINKWVESGEQTANEQKSLDDFVPLDFTDQKAVQFDTNKSSKKLDKNEDELNESLKFADNLSLSEKEDDNLKDEFTKLGRSYHIEESSSEDLDAISKSIHHQYRKGDFLPEEKEVSITKTSKNREKLIKESSINLGSPEDTSSPAKASPKNQNEIDDYIEKKCEKIFQDMIKKNILPIAEKVIKEEIRKLTQQE